MVPKGSCTIQCMYVKINKRYNNNGLVLVPYIWYRSVAFLKCYSQELISNQQQYKNKPNMMQNRSHQKHGVLFSKCCHLYNNNVVYNPNSTRL